MRNGLRHIYMNELILMINRKDIRSGITWCNTNDIEIYKDSSGKFVVESEFNLAYDLPVIKRYKEKYKDNWEEMYELAKSDTLYKSISITSNISNKRYKPKGKGGTDLLKKYNK
jgi:hypothetical protein